MFAFLCYTEVTYSVNLYSETFSHHSYMCHSLLVPKSYPYKQCLIIVDVAFLKGSFSASV
jgi:hypothetical protein